MITRTRILFLAGIIATAIGLAGMIPTVYFNMINNRLNVGAATTVVQQPVLTKKVISGKPEQLILPDLKINLDVAEGHYNQRTGEWTLSLNKAHFALISTPPNDEQGNTVIYGHYRPEVFAYLHKIKPGQKALIQTDNGYEFVYTFNSTKAVNPRDTSIFGYSGTPILTIQTCSGAWMQNRQLYNFSFESVNKINEV